MTNFGHQSESTKPNEWFCHFWVIYNNKYDESRLCAWNGLIDEYSDADDYDGRRRKFIRWFDDDVDDDANNGK